MSGAFSHTLVYATCASGCAAAANWQKTELPLPADCDSPQNSGLVLDAQGRLSFLMSDGNDTRACLVTCEGNCGSAASWQSGLVASIPSSSPRSAFALAGHGTTLHLLFNDGQSALRYQSCASQCTSQANWQLSQPLFWHAGWQLALAASAQGAVTVAYNQGTLPGTAPADAKAFDNQLHLFECTANCGDPMAWVGFSTSTTDGEHGVAITARNGQVAVATAQTSGAKVYVCGMGGCGASAGWGAGEIESISSLNAAMPDPNALASCTVNGQPVAPQQAAWHPEKPSVAVGSDALLVQVATNGLHTCPGLNPSSYPGQGRMHYVR